MDDIRTPVTGLGAPTEGEHPYLMWDAAYVLGSLSAADRREFEAHLAGCASCRAAVAELCGVPALLSQLGADEVAAIGEPGVAAGTTSGSPQMSSQLLPTLLATVRWRRRRTRLAIWVASSAAAVFLGIGVLVGVVGHSASAPVQTASAQPMAQVGTHLLESTVSVDGMHWGRSSICDASAWRHRMPTMTRWPWSWSDVTAAKPGWRPGSPSRGTPPPPPAASRCRSTRSRPCRWSPPIAARFCCSVRSEAGDPRPTAVLAPISQAITGPGGLCGKKGCGPGQQT